MLILTTSSQDTIGSPSQSSKARKRKKRHSTGKEKVKLSLFTEDMILHVEHPRVSPKPHTQLLELINEFNKVARYKINIQKSAVFLYIHKNNPKRKLSSFNQNGIEKNKMLGNKPNGGGERLTH